MGQPPKKAEGGKQKGLLAEKTEHLPWDSPGDEGGDGGDAVSAQRDKSHRGRGDPAWEPLWAPELGQGTWGRADSLASHLHLLSPPQEAPVDGKEVSRSREAGGLGTAHLIPVSWGHK